MLGLQDLLSAVNSAPAIRYQVTYQPTAGQGTKVFPALFSTDGQGSTYAFETRFIDGQRVKCALVDSVPSQANRLEEALSDARALDDFNFPAIIVDLSAFNHGQVSTLDLPHRAADAYLTFANKDGQPWTKHERYKAIANSGPRHATAIYLHDPVSLLFGVWFSHDKNAVGRFARLLVSEMVGINAEQGVKSASRLDPLGADTATKIDGETLEQWEIGESKEKKLSELGFGNVLPTVDKMGGITCDHVLQTATISLSGLRRLSFPADDGKTTPDRDNAARAVLAALGLVAIESTATQGVWLRSRCDLVSTEYKREILGQGDYELTADVAVSLFKDAVAHAKSNGLLWGDNLVLDGNSDVLQKRFADLKGAEA